MDSWNLRMAHAGYDSLDEEVKSIRQEALASLRERSLWQKVRHFEQNERDLHTLDFILPRMVFHKAQVDVAPGILKQLAGISNLHAELSAFADSKSFIGKLVSDIFVQEVELCLSEGGPLPTADQMAAFLQGAISKNDEKVPECDNMTLKECAKTYCMKFDDSPEKQKVLSHLNVIKETVMKHFIALKDEHSPNQLIQWATVPLWSPVSTSGQTTSTALIAQCHWTNSNLFAFGGVIKKVKRSQRLPWTPLVDFYVLQENLGLLDLIDTQCKSREVQLQDSCTSFARERMPRLMYDLQEIRSEIYQQIETVKALRAKLLAGAVTVGITAGQFLANEMVKYVGDKSDENK